MRTVRRQDDEHEADEAGTSTRSPAPAPAGLTEAGILSLQQGAGNSAVSRMLARSTLARNEGEEGAGPGEDHQGPDSFMDVLNNTADRIHDAGQAGADAYYEATQDSPLPAAPQGGRQPDTIEQASPSDVRQFDQDREAELTKPPKTLTDFDAVRGAVTDPHYGIKAVGDGPTPTTEVPTSMPPLR